MKKLVSDPRFGLAGLVVLAVVFLAVFGAELAPRDPYAMGAATRFASPGTGSMPLGGDEYGRDILSRLMHGARISLVVGAGSVMLAALLGAFLGMAAAYFGGRVDMVIMRAVDVVLSLPTIIFAIFVLSVLGSKLPVLIVTIGILYIPRFARLMYGVTLAAKEFEYVEASLALGTGQWRILFGRILPNVFAPLLVQVTLSLGDAILLESSLSFLGLGPPPPAIAWGRMVAESGPFMHISPYGLIWPALVISVTVIAFNILGDLIRDVLDKRRG